MRSADIFSTPHKLIVKSSNYCITSLFKGNLLVFIHTTDDRILTTWIVFQKIFTWWVFSTTFVVCIKADLRQKIEKLGSCNGHTSIINRCYWSINKIFFTKITERHIYTIFILNIDLIQEFLHKKKVILKSFHTISRINFSFWKITWCCYWWDARRRIEKGITYNAITIGKRWIESRTLWKRCEYRCSKYANILCALTKICFWSFFDTISVVTKRNFIEVEFKNLILGITLIQFIRKPRLSDFSRKSFLRCE